MKNFVERRKKNKKTVFPDFVCKALFDINCLIERKKKKGDKGQKTK